MQAIRLIVFLCLVQFVSACTSLPKAPEQLNVSLHQSELAKFEDWRIKGKMGFKSTEESFSASMNWQQLRQTFHLRLTSFIGTTLMEMQGDGRKATLHADDQTFTDNDPSELVWRTTGWNIPVNNLPFWIKGQALPGDKAIYDENGLVESLRPACYDCGQWEISYSRYRQVGELWLPHDIRLQNQASPDNLIKIRISQWQTQ